MRIAPLAERATFLGKHLWFRSRRVVRNDCVHESGAHLAVLNRSTLLASIGNLDYCHILNAEAYRLTG